MRTFKSMFFIVILLVPFFSGCARTDTVARGSRHATDFDKQLNQLAAEMVASLAEEDKSKIAIMEFPDLYGNISELGKLIPEELTTRLFKTRRFEVVERQLLNQLLNEQNLGLSGLIDATTAAEIGKMLGVDAIVTGTIADIGSAIRINSRIIATETAGVFAVSSVSLQKEEHVLAMLNRKPAETHTAGMENESGSGSTTRHKIQKTFTGMVDQVQLKLVRVTHQQERLTFEFMAVNTGLNDQYIRMGIDSRIICDLGNEYTFRNLEISGYTDMAKNMVPGIPMRMVATLRVPEKQIGFIRLAEFEFYQEADRLMFRDVPIPYGDDP